MGLVVQHNMTAMNANRQLGVTSSAQAKATEKLSSGYRINRAGDDAAGLTISEKMRSQIRGLDKASTNAQDGISLIQSAEGALNEAHSILQRMNELAVQGANDTNQESERDAINKELIALTDELDRIAQTTQFNKQELLDGSFNNKKLQVGANANQYIEISINAMNADALGLGKVNVDNYSTSVVSHSEVQTINYDKYNVNIKYDTTTGINKNMSNARDEAWDYISKTFKSFTDLKESQDFKVEWTGSATATTASQTWILYSANGGIYGSYDTTESLYYNAMSMMYADASNVAWNSQDSLVTVKEWTGTRQDKDGTKTERYGCRVDDYSAANTTITKIQEAINRVSDQRSALGALQNRLEHTVANLDTVSENTSAAESRIRDTDMAKMMVEYSKNSILTQAGQSMLAQANQSTQGVLSLLQ